MRLEVSKKLKVRTQPLSSRRSLSDSFVIYASGQTLFLHHQVPGLVAEICGMVVGVTPKEEQVSYEGESYPSFQRSLI